MHSVHYYTRSPPGVQDSRIEEFIAVSKVLENLDKPDRRQTVSTSLWIAICDEVSATIDVAESARAVYHLMSLTNI